MAEASCREEVSFNVELAVVEAVNNAIEHAYQNEPGHEVMVTLTIAGPNVHVGVADQGRPIPPEILEQSSQSLSNDPVDLSDGGRGLAIIRQAMDRVSYETAGGSNVLYMAKAWQPKPVLT